MSHIPGSQGVPGTGAAAGERHPRRGRGGRGHGLASHTVPVGLAALVWLILRTGRKPTRLSYPCQQAALGSVSLLFAVSLAPWLFQAGSWLWRRRSRLAAAAGLLAVLPLGGHWDTTSGRCVTDRLARAPADYGADVYVIENAGGPAGDHHRGVDALVAGMGAAGLKLYRSATSGAESGPDGLVGVNDVVLIKINQQWPERGGTNTDVLKGLIARILEHPDGFGGEVVVVENGQGLGSLDWPASNAEDHGQSALDVVTHFAGLGQPVSAYLWDGIRGVSVAEYSAGDLRDGYVVGPWDAGAQISVSYPKFRTAGGHHVSLQHGVWDPAAGTYDDTRLRFFNLPVLKCHSIYGVTASLKHHVGTMTTALGTNTHAAVASGGLGSFLSQVRMPDLNILDCIYILADPNAGPACSYGQATRADQLAASRDPVALDLWADANILVPAMVANGFTAFPRQDPADSNSVFRRYLDRTAARLIAAGIPVTNDPARITAHVWSGVGVDRERNATRAGAYPNPFASTTSIRFVPRRSGIARLDVYDLTGRLQRSVHASVREGAAQEIRWDGRDERGQRLRAGTYYYRVSGAGSQASGRATLLH